MSAESWVSRPLSQLSNRELVERYIKAVDEAGG